LSVAAQKKGCALQYEKEIAVSEEIIRDLKLKIMEIEDEEDLIFDLEEQLAEKVEEMDSELVQNTPAELATLKEEATSLRQAITNRKKKRDEGIALLENKIATHHKKIHLAVVERDIFIQKLDDDEKMPADHSDVHDPIDNLKFKEESEKSTRIESEDLIPAEEDNTNVVQSTNSRYSVVTSILKQTEALPESVKSSGNSAKFLARSSDGRDLAESNGRRKQWLQFINDFAEVTLARKSHEQSLVEELRCLNGGKKAPVMSRLFNLASFLEVMMKEQGRFGKEGTLDYDVKQLIILKPNHHFTKLLLQWYHGRFGYQGQNSEGNDVRQRYWIVNGMSAVKKVFQSGIGHKYGKMKPSSVNMADTWKFLLGSGKMTLAGILIESHPQEVTLHVDLSEVQAILNNRSLTDVSVDPDDPECLTPNHFLLGWSSGLQKHEVTKLGQFSDDDLFLRKKWRIAQRMADNFWIRWRKEYLPILTRRTKWIQCGVEIKVGDVVVIIEDNAVRGSWPLGRVIRTYPGTDSRVRVVDVKTSTGTYKRPVSKICRLDVQKCEDEVPSSGG
jgi:hypothetical protein